MISHLNSTLDKYEEVISLSSTLPVNVKEGRFRVSHFLFQSSHSVQNVQLLGKGLNKKQKFLRMK